MTLSLLRCRCLAVLCITLVIACSPHGRAISQHPLATRPCPSAADLQVAALADAQRDVHDFPRHSYVTYLIHGSVVAANLRQDSLALYEAPRGGIRAIDTIRSGSIVDTKVFKAGNAPAAFAICPGVAAVDFRIDTAR